MNVLTLSLKLHQYCSQVILIIFGDEVNGLSTFFSLRTYSCAGLV